MAAMPMAAIARRRARIPKWLIEWDDQLQIARMGIVIADRDFKDEGPAAFSSFAFLCALHELGNARVAMTAKKRRPSERLICVLDDSEVSNRHPDPAELAEHREFVEYAMRLLTDQEQDVVRKYLFDGMDFQQIADSLALTDHRIFQIWQRAIKWIRAIATSDALPDAKKDIAIARLERKKTRRGHPTGKNKRIFKPVSEWDWTKSNVELAREIGCSASYVGCERSRLGKPKSPNFREGIDHTKIDWSLRSVDIAKQIGCSAQTIRHLRFRLRKRNLISA